MLRTIAQQLKEFRKTALVTPVWMLGEVICEMVIPAKIPNSMT